VERISCRVIRGEGTYEGKQGLSYVTGITAENVGAQHLCLHQLVIPPGGRARAHLHTDHESAILLLRGEVDVFWGDQLEEHARMNEGDFIYIPPGVPHLPINASATEPAMAVVARTDPSEQESVVLLPDLDALADGFGSTDAGVGQRELDPRALRH